MNINYIVACYLGTRRNQPLHPTGTFISKHLEFLKDTDAVSRITLSISIEDRLQEEAVRDLMEPYKSYSPHIKLILRDNRGHSYGAWNDAICHSLESGEKFDYYFCIEDDYVPVTKDFAIPFVDKVTDSTGYVCQVAQDTHGHRHAAVSNGLIPYRAASLMYKGMNTVFKVTQSKTYIEGERNQIHFLDYLDDSGFEMVDCSDTTTTEYLALNHSGSTSIQKFGSGPNVIAPIVV